jgi:hypothetical protein
MPIVYIADAMDVLVIERDDHIGSRWFLGVAVVTFVVVIVYLIRSRVNESKKNDTDQKNEELKQEEENELR